MITAAPTPVVRPMTTRLFISSVVPTTDGQAALPARICANPHAVNSPVAIFLQNLYHGLLFCTCTRRQAVKVEDYRRLSYG